MFSFEGMGLQEIPPQLSRQSMRLLTAVSLVRVQQGERARQREDAKKPVNNTVYGFFVFEGNTPNDTDMVTNRKKFLSSYKQNYIAFGL